MRFNLRIETNHAAFVEDEGNLEIARILRLVSELVTHGHGGIVGGGFDDPDGNLIGSWHHFQGLRPIAPPGDQDDLTLK